TFRGEQQTQVIDFTGPGAGTAVTLTFNGSAPSNPPVVYTGNAAVDAAALQAALQSLSTVGARLATGGPPDIGGRFTVTFNGQLALTDQPLVGAAITAGPGSVTVLDSGSGGYVKVYKIGVNLYNVVFLGTFAGLDQKLISGVKEVQQLDLTTMSS